VSIFPRQIQVGLTGPKALNRRKPDSVILSGSWNTNTVACFYSTKLLVSCSVTSHELQLNQNSVISVSFFKLNQGCRNFPSSRNHFKIQLPESGHEWSSYRLTTHNIRCRCTKFSCHGSLAAGFGRFWTKLLGVPPKQAVKTVSETATFLLHRFLVLEVFYCYYCCCCCFSLSLFVLRNLTISHLYHVCNCYLTHTTFFYVFVMCRCFYGGAQWRSG